MILHMFLIRIANCTLYDYDFTKRRFDCIFNVSLIINKVIILQNIVKVSVLYIHNHTKYRRLAVSWVTFTFLG